MEQSELKQRAHERDVTLWVGKSGLEAVVDELDAQLNNEPVVKVKFLRAARTGNSTEEQAVDLAERAGARVFETRGHTAVFYR